ncbi:MAG TPA: hypothetical protein ENH10_01635 [Bacteroidetes bacterium]|nr:hypothetical protein [Bacteroidota bacterium]HEX03848.1 hypothetical protein [Bacteroidota bacterium]
MAYSGSTAASSVANPPTRMAGPLTRGTTDGPDPRGGSLWHYHSADGSTVVSAANYFTDAYELGMRPGDIVMGSYASSVASTDGYAYRLWCSGITTSGASFSTGAMSTG